MNSRWGILGWLGLALVLLIPQAADSVEVGFTVTPAKLEIPIPAGASYNIPLTVHNPSFDAVHIQATMVDFGVTSNGSYEFQRVGSRPYSLLKWAAIRPREFDLAPGTSQQVQLTVQVPQTPGLSGEYAGIVFFQSRPPRAPSKGVAFSVRIASKIYETIPGTVKIEGAITKMTATTGNRGEAYHVLFKNTGNAHVYLRGTLVIQKGNGTVDQLQLANGELVERGGERTLEIIGKRLDPGSYQAIATLDYGGKTDTGGEIAFEVR
jgi:P pilus assembly chaperone PapD